jgi:hypothetical protein
LRPQNLSNDQSFTRTFFLIHALRYLRAEIADMSAQLEFAEQSFESCSSYICQRFTNVRQKLCNLVSICSCEIFEFMDARLEFCLVRTILSCKLQRNQSVVFRTLESCEVAFREPFLKSSIGCHKPCNVRKVSKTSSCFKKECKLFLWICAPLGIVVEG